MCHERPVVLLVSTMNFIMLTSPSSIYSSSIVPLHSGERNGREMNTRGARESDKEPDHQPSYWPWTLCFLQHAIQLFIDADRSKLQNIPFIVWQFAWLSLVANGHVKSIAIKICFCPSIVAQRWIAPDWLWSLYLFSYLHTRFNVGPIAVGPHKVISWPASNLGPLG